MKTLKVALAVASTLLAAVCLAEPVSEEMAAKAAGNWRVRRGQLGAKLGAKVRSARRVDHKGACFNVVRFEGGGYAVTPTDTTIRPIILFSEGDDFAVDERNPALELLVGELSPLSAKESAQATQTTFSRAEAAWSELLDDRLPLEKGGKKQIDVIYVDPIVKTQWDQGSVGGQPCYNSCTPSNYVCGCVATAGSQILRTLKFPNTSVEPFTGNCLVDGEPVDLTAQGGLYDWDNMPEVPEQVTLTETQRRAIGKLTSDVGISVDMGYAADGSGSNTFRLQYAFKHFFGLPHACFGFARSRPSAAIDDTMGEVMRANFDAKLPVAIGIRGHSIVGDGYGYLGDTLYYHLNMGWGVGSNVWYAPPDDFGSWKGFEYACHNIYTNAAMNNLVIASGRLTDVHGQPLEGVRVWAEDDAGAQVGEAVESDVRGIYALFVPPGKYRVRAKELVRDDNGRPLYELVGVTTSSPTKCSTVETIKSEWGWDYWDIEGDYVICGNDSGCDMELEPVTRAPTVSMGEIALGADFAELTVPVTVCATYFGSETHPARLDVRLFQGETVRATKTFELTDDSERTLEVSFEELTPGETYVLRSFVCLDEETLAVTEPEAFTAARSVEVSEPLEVVLASENIVIDLNIDAFSVFEQLTNVTAAAAVTAFENDDGTGEFAIWSGSSWVPTGIAAELHATHRVSVLRRPDKTPLYRLWRGGMWIDLGVAPAQPVRYDEVTADGSAHVLALQGVFYDANRLLCTADGSEYADLTAALQAGELRTLTPLWRTNGIVPDDVKLAVLSILDPNGLLTLTGGTLLKTTKAPDGTVTYSYGTMDPKDVQASDYLKATCALGLSRPIQATSEIVLGDVSVSEGALTFTVSVDDEQVLREQIKDFVRVTDDLQSGWRTPEPSEIVVKDGTVAVEPETVKDRAFVQVELPKD